MVDRQEEISGQIVGRGDPPDQAAPVPCPPVTSNLVSAKPSAFSFSSIRCARRRLKTNSATLRALIAPSEFGGMPDIDDDPEFRGIARCRDRFQSGRMQAGRRQRGKLHMAGFGDAAGFADAGMLRREWRGFGAAARFDDLPGFDEPLNISDSQPAWLASIGSSSNAAIAAMMVRRRRTPRRERANFLPDNSNPGSPGVISVRAP